MATKLALLLVCTAVFLAVANASTFTLQARNLPSTGGAVPNSYINVYYASSATAPYQLLGRTNHVSGNNPDFSEVYEIPEGGESSEALKFDIFNFDNSDLDGDDYIGYVWTRITTIEGVFHKNIWATPAGNLYVKMQ